MSETRLRILSQEKYIEVVKEHIKDGKPISELPMFCRKPFSEVCFLCCFVHYWNDKEDHHKKCLLLPLCQALALGLGLDPRL